MPLWSLVEKDKRSGKETSQVIWHRRPIVSLRVLSDQGRYPTFSIKKRSHVFVANESLVWSAVIQRPLGRSWLVGEMFDLYPEEVRLFSAITLSEADPWSNGYLYSVNGPQAIHDCDSIGIDRLDGRENFERVAAMASQLASEGGHDRASPGSIHELSNRTGSKADALSILSGLDVKDQLLIAGLSRLLGANRILAMVDATEAACVVLMVSLGSALEFIRQSLGFTRGRDQSFAAVYEYLRCVYPNENYLTPFLEEMYEARVMIQHPSSRFGDVWAPPLMAGDVWELRKVLSVLYRHIILDEMRIDPIG